MTTRHIRVYGKATIGTKIDCWVNEEYCSSVVNGSMVSPFDSDEVLIYEFSTDTQFNGYTKIKLRCSENIVLGRAIATYPAVWVDDSCTEHHGILNSHQTPVPDPKYLVRFDGKLWEKGPEFSDLTGEWIHALDANVTMEFYHLTRNGYNGYYLHLEYYPEVQKKWIETKVFNAPEFEHLNIVGEGILKRLYPIRLINETELNALKELAKKDYDKSQHQK